MKSIQTFLEKFNRYPFGEKPKILLQAWEKFFEIQHAQPEDTNELFQKLLEDLHIISEELSEYINSPSWNYPTFFDDDEEHLIQYKEYLEKSPNVIAPVLPNKEHEYSLSMGYDHLSTTPKTESDEVTESSVKNLVPIPSEYEVTSDEESEYDVPIKDDSSLYFTTFSNPLFDYNDDFTFSDDDSLLDEDVPTEEFKVYSNPLFDDEEINSNKLDPHCFNVESDLIESLLNRNTLIDSSPKFDFLLKEFSEIDNMIVESLSPFPIPVEDSDSLMDEIDLFLATDELLHSNIESDGYDSEEYIHFLEELLINYSIPNSKNELSKFNHQDNLSFPRPPPEPPDVEFDLEPDAGEVISVVMNNIKELNEDKCFDPGGEINVFTNVEDDDYVPFIFVIQIFLPYLIYPEVFLLLLSAESEDTIFDPGILV
nr:hypothetical protein [Tanacetum cinerariifolium]